MSNIVLYHGTNSSFYQKIKKEGIQPREKTSNSNWALQSKEGFVYLTDTFPFYFAYASCKQKQKPVILEVEVDVKYLFPDEDFLGQVFKENYPEYFENKTLIEVTEFIDIRYKQYKKYWKQSLENFGNVAYKGAIKKEQIKRVLFADEFLEKEFYNLIDHSISIIFKKIRGKLYKDFISFSFGDRKENPFEEERKSFEKILQGVKDGKRN